VTDYRPVDQGSIPSKGKDYFFVTTSGLGASDSCPVGFEVSVVGVKLLISPPSRLRGTACLSKKVMVKLSL
jgi:hypothetical protein